MLVGLAVPTVTASAQGAAEGPERVAAARRVFGDAQRAFASGQHRLAAAGFLEALRLSGRPAAAFNAARCFEILAEPIEALRYYRRYLELAPQAADRDEVRRKIEHLERQAPPIAPPAVPVAAAVPPAPPASPAPPTETHLGAAATAEAERRAVAESPVAAPPPAPAAARFPTWAWIVAAGVAVAAGLTVTAIAAGQPLPRATLGEVDTRE